MLSRVADAVFWMSRYIERAENVARFIDVNQAISLGGRIGMADQWAPLIFASGDEDLYQELYGEFSRKNVLRFLTFDRRNPNSIISCVAGARENARTIRDILSTAMWEAVNRFHLRVREALSEERGILNNPHDFLERVKRASHQVIGVTGVTFSHGEAWNFATLGRLLERADKTSRILDVKYFTLLPNVSLVGSSIDIVQWSALLESTSALHMYRKRFGRIAFINVIDFLVLDRHFPRSMRFCLSEAEQCLHAITGAPMGTFSNKAEQLLGVLNAKLNFSSVEDIRAQGLHEFIDEVQDRINAIGAEVFNQFFHVAPPEEVLNPEPAQTQSQSSGLGTSQFQVQR
ncbi:MAG: alpha-E domain-containing protein [Planctomycetaceae bacterium]